MPGPKMGARPADFDEIGIKASPTYRKWLKLEKGETLRYACRDFVKGHGEDEERLMRRIMIARRNNVKDQERLKRAREKQSANKRRKQASTDAEIEREMDVDAVKATRSYRKWLELEDGAEFQYNQRYIKGKDGDDWLLQKNIWR